MPIAYLADEPAIAHECIRCHVAFRSKCRNVKRCPTCRKLRKVEAQVPYCERKARRNRRGMGVR
jgi:hypothetical protein